MKQFRNNRKQKRFIGFFTALICSLFLAVLPTVQTYAYVNTVGIIANGGARIRATASTESATLASVEGGARVEICGTVLGDDSYTWYRIYIDGKSTGYVRGDRITDTGEKTGGIGGDTQTGNENTTGADNPENTQNPQENPNEEGNTTETDLPGTEGNAQSDATLGKLNVSNGEMEPMFQPGITEYTVQLEEGITGISAFGVPNAEGAVVTENYGFSDLEIGTNLAIITVTAADGTQLTYTFYINRGEPSDEIHYATNPGTITEETPVMTPNPTQTQETSGVTIVDHSTSKKTSSHTGLIVFLIILVLLMGAVIVLMGMRIRDYRRELYGEDANEFHLFEEIPFLKRFAKKEKKTGHQRMNPNAPKREPVRQSLSSETKKKVVEPEAVIKEKEAFYDAPEESKQFDFQGSETLKVEDGFMYDMKAAAVKETPQFTQPESDFDEDFEEEIEGALEADLDEDWDEDALEDINERNETVTDNQSGKEMWRSVNFMTPQDDLEFEFLDIEDND